MSNINVKYIHVLNNFYELAGPPLELEASIPLLAEPKELVPPPAEPWASIPSLDKNVD